MGELIQEPRLWGGICLLIWLGSVGWSLKQVLARRRRSRDGHEPGIPLLLLSALLWLAGWSATAWVTLWLYAWIGSQSLWLPLLVMLARTGIDAIFLGGLHPPRPVTGFRSIVAHLTDRVLMEIPRLFFFFGLFGIWLGGLV